MSILRGVDLDSARDVWIWLDLVTVAWIMYLIWFQWCCSSRVLGLVVVIGAAGFSEVLRGQPSRPAASRD